MLIEEIRFVTGRRQTGKSFELIELIKDQIEADRSKPIVVSAIGIKLSALTDVVSRDDKDIYLAVIHPLDRTVKVIKEGKLYTLTNKEFFSLELKELSNIAAFVDDCFIGSSRVISERLIKSKRVSSISLTCLNYDLQEVRSKLFHPTIRERIEMEIIKVDFNGKDYTRSESIYKEEK